MRDNESQFGKIVDAYKHSEYWQYVCNQCNIFMDNYTMIFQPKGMNTMSNGAANHYGRILINFKEINKNDLKEEDLVNLSKVDRDVFDEEMRINYKEQYDCTTNIGITGVGKFRWAPMTFTSIDGIYCQILDYNRPGIGAETHVVSYQFYKNNKFMEVTLSYNTKDEDVFKNDFEQFISYLQFDNEFKSGNYGVSSPTLKVIKSSIHNIQYTYNTQHLTPGTIKTAEHIFMKLGSIDSQVNLTFLADPSADLTGYSIYDEYLVDYFKQADKAITFSTNRNMLSSCSKVSIDSHKALRSEYYEYVPQLNTTIYTIVYRFINYGELQTYNIFVTKEYRTQHPNYDKDFILGIKFL